jgi:hypothetical protein
MLSKEFLRVWELGNVNEFLLAPNAVIYKGAALGDNGSGLARPLVSGDQFLGFAEHAASSLEDNRYARVLASGLVQLPVAGLKPNALHAVVYASDENNFNLTQGSPIGTAYRLLDNGEAIVAFGSEAHPPLAPYRLLFARCHKTVGGSSTEKIPCLGLLASDIVQVTLGATGKTPCSIQSATPTNNSLHVSFNSDPGTDHLVHYVIVRSLNN